MSTKTPRNVSASVEIQCWTAVFALAVPWLITSSGVTTILKTRTGCIYLALWTRLYQSRLDCACASDGSIAVVVPLDFWHCLFIASVTHTFFVHAKHLSKSTISELSDLPVPDPSPLGNGDFNEGLKTVWGAVHPDITSTGNEDVVPTHLYPFKGSPLTRRLSPKMRKKNKRQISSDVSNWPQ